MSGESADECVESLIVKESSADPSVDSNSVDRKSLTEATCYQLKSIKFDFDCK